MGMQASNSDPRSLGHAFAPTPWTMVMAAGLNSGPGSSEALEGLCRAYWPPIYNHLRMRGQDRHQAQDLTQEFFTRLLRGNAFAGVSPDKGRFRTFLLAALRHFLINEWKRENALKRGGAVAFVDLDALDPSVRDACEPRDGEDPLLAFDQRWALTLIAKVRDRLRREYEAAGQFDRHEALKVHLMDEGSRSVMETADLLGLTEAATKSAIHRIRRRFAELLRAEIGRTVADPAEVEDEIRHLLAALRGL
jgi:RNA polymerase sigma factor (sigma-70 family)